MEFYYDDEVDRVRFKCPHMHAYGYLPLGGEHGWTLVSIDPLTVTPSIHNMPCGCHGFITNGEWVPA